MLCSRNKRRIAISLLSILLMLEIYGVDGQRNGSSRDGRPDISRALLQFFTSFANNLRDRLKPAPLKEVKPFSRQFGESKVEKIKNETADDPEASVESNVLACFRADLNLVEKFEKWLWGNKYESDKSKLFMRSRKMKERRDLALADLSNLQAIDFDIRRKTFFIIHGFMSNSLADWVSTMEDVLLQLEDANVISVDWSSEKFMAWDYLKSVAITDDVGNQIATLLQNISAAAAEKQGIPKENWGRLHFIGHSLGSHISGFTAHELKKRQAQWQIDRISGLDPAKPCFVRKVEDNLKLDRGDAPFVDVIHTDTDPLQKGGLGLADPIGHFDFYPNGGKHQPGCSDIQLPYYLPLPIKWLEKRIAKATCNHGKAYKYFTESIVHLLAKDCHFWSEAWNLTIPGGTRTPLNACNANACVEMGINSETYFKGENGTFYVTTAATPPYCIPD